MDDVKNETPGPYVWGESVPNALVEDVALSGPTQSDDTTIMDALLKVQDDQIGGFGMVKPDAFPGRKAHENGDPMLNGDSQYGASPIRDVRYKDNHEANADMEEGRLKSGHNDAQARYPRAEETSSKPETGHDEQQLSRDLKRDGQ